MLPKKNLRATKPDTLVQESGKSPTPSIAHAIDLLAAMSPHCDQTLIRKLLTTVNDQGRQICELKQRLEQHREREKSQLEILADKPKPSTISSVGDLSWQKEEQDLGKKATQLDKRERGLGRMNTVFNRATESAKTTSKKTMTFTTALPSDQDITKAQHINYIAFGPVKRQVKRKSVAHQLVSHSFVRKCHYQHGRHESQTASAS